MKLIILSVIISFGFLPATADNNFDWLTEYHWHITDGRSIAGIGASIDRNEPFLARFRRMELPPGSVLLQERRILQFIGFDEIRFMLLYQMREDINTLHIVENSYFYNGVYSLEWRNDFNRVSMRLNGRLRGNMLRIAGGQVNRSLPIVGEWWRNSEYRIVNPVGVIYYVEIERFTGWAIRPGIYPLKQVGENVFETVSSFSDGHLRLEILRENRIILVTPLFSGEEEEEYMYPLALERSRLRIQDYE